MAPATAGVPAVRLSGYYFCYFAFIGVFMPYFALYLQQRGFPAAEIGLLMSVLQLMRLLAPNLWGWLADRLGRRTPVIRIAAVLSLLGFTAVPFVDGFWPVALALAVMGFFWTAQHPLTEALTFAHLRGQPERYGPIRAWGSWGFIAASAGLGWWLERAGMDWVAWCGIGLLAAIVIAALWVPEAPVCPRAHAERSLWAVLRQREVKAFLLAAFFMSAAHGAFYVFFSIHLVEAGYSKTSVGLLWTLGVLAEIVVFTFAAPLLRRWSSRGILLACFAIGIVRFLLMGWWVESVLLMVLAQLMHAATFGAYHAAAVSTVHRWFGERNQAQGQALYGSLSFGGGGILGAVASGAAWESWGAGMTFSLGSFFALAGLIAVWQGWPARLAVPEAGNKE
ncbi:MFS transporter [Uliginosibacterium sp. H1]|uniref:MFS transporter n=1 Tax=Uliginosibacterium sp. H1 TaxID=3114757 RepID=UPI002E17593D|nr:MFS transporter [Uliginosibacterium sp. H1]